MLFCEISKVVGWKSQVDLCNVFVPAVFANFGLVLIGLLYLLFVAIVLTTLAYFLWSVDVREYFRCMNRKRSNVANGKLRAILELSRELDGSPGANHDDEIGNKRPQMM